MGLGLPGAGNFAASTNMMNIGLNYSANGGLSGNVAGFNVSQYGVSFNPSLTVGYKFTYNPKETRQYVAFGDDDTGDGSGPPVEYSTENANSFIDKNIVRPKGLIDLYADGTVPEGDQYENGRIITSDGRTVDGVTVLPKGWNQRNSYVYLAASVFKTTNLLYIAIQHEFGHVTLNYLGYSSHAHGRWSLKGLDNNYVDYQEALMYSISAAQARMWGMKNQADIFQAKANEYAKSNNVAPIPSNFLNIKHNQPIW